ncbi:MAG: T9SS type A sorting domain-containing protein [Ignavibacteria bacterium]
MKVYDMLGREVKTLVNEVQKAGVYEVEFNGANLASGIYFYKLRAGDYVSVKKLMLLK